MQDDLLPVRYRQKLRDRLFFAILPDIATAIRIDQVARQFFRDHQIAAVPIAIKRQHISIHHVADMPHLLENLVSDVRRAANSFFMPGFDVVLDAIGSFAGGAARGPVVLRANGDGLFELFNSLGLALSGYDLPASRRLSPHLTLCYNQHAIPFQAIAPIRFVAKELVLIHSEVGLTRHHVLGRWPFHRARPGASVFPVRRIAPSRVKRLSPQTPSQEELRLTPSAGSGERHMKPLEDGDQNARGLVMVVREE